MCLSTKPHLTRGKEEGPKNSKKEKMIMRLRMMKNMMRVEVWVGIERRGKKDWSKETQKIFSISFTELCYNTCRSIFLLNNFLKLEIFNQIGIFFSRYWKTKSMTKSCGKCLKLGTWTGRLYLVTGLMRIER